MIPGARVPHLSRSQRATDFSDYPIANMVGNGWTVITTATSNISAAIAAASGTLSGRRAQIVKLTANSYRLIGWDQVPTVADIEVLARVNILSFPASLTEPTTCQLTARADPADGDPYYIALFSRAGPSQEALEIGRGDGAGGGVAITNIDKNFTTGLWWIRARFIGNTQKAKAWQGALSAEPSAWDLSATDTNVPAAGKFGLGMFYTANNYAVDWLSIGLNGATAPSPGG